MKTLAVANQKGGVGKTTVTVHMAHYAAELGARVVVVDLDPQRNTTTTLPGLSCGVTSTQLFQDKLVELPKLDSAITVIEAERSLVDIDRAPYEVKDYFARHIASFAPHFDLCLIDTAPDPGLRLVSAMAAADYVLSPIDLDQYSIDGVHEMLQMIKACRDRFNPKLKFVGILPNKVNTHSPVQKLNMVSLMKAYSTMVLPAAIALRSSIGEAASERLPVWSMKKTSAREAGREIRKAMALIAERMGGLTSGA